MRSDRTARCSCFARRSGVSRVPKTNHVKDRCEWGHDDYSLNVENLPKCGASRGYSRIGRGGCWRLGADTTMRPMPVVAVVGPFAQARLDEALGLAVGLGRVGLGSDVLEAEELACPGERFGSIAGAVVGHDTLDSHAQAGVIGDGGLEKRERAFFLLVLHDLTEGDPGCIVDADVDELPADATVAVDCACLSSSDPMAHRSDPSKLLDIDMNELAWLLAL